MQGEIKHINIDNDRILVFGGPYSNIQALESLRSEADKKGFRPKDIICTGDIIAYCAHPNECVSLIKDWGIHCIAGNVELNLRDNVDDCGCNFDEGSRCDMFSRQWYPFAKETISKESLQFISDLPEYLSFEINGKKVFVLHGSAHDTSEFIFASTSAEIKLKNFHKTKSDIIIAGHCGIPFSEKLDTKWWINSGVIGMPANDGNTNTWYSIVDLKEEKASFYPLEYDFHSAAQEMKSKKLPLSYSKTLVTGIWDNCDILPEKETSLQGQPLVL